MPFFPTSQIRCCCCRPRWRIGSEDHLARFVNDVVDSLDLTAIENAHDEGRGYPPYHPRMMVKVLLHAPLPGRREPAGFSYAERLSQAAREPSNRAVRAGAAAVSQGRADPVRAGCHRWDQAQGHASKHKAMSDAAPPSHNARSQDARPAALIPAAARAITGGRSARPT